MINNVKSFPPEWDKFDSNNFGGASVELDTTLSKAGKAADAKAVGDALAEKQPKGDYLINVVDVNSDEQGVGYLTLDATNEQIYTAYESGKHVLINILGLANAQVQKNQDGSLYAIVFMPQTVGISGLTKLRVYYLEAMNPKWRMYITYISATAE